MRSHKTTTKSKTYILLSRGKFHSRNRLVEVRKKFGFRTKYSDRCFVCNHKFEDGEMLYLATSGAKGSKNCFVCKKCAERINKEN